MAARADAGPLAGEVSADVAVIGAGFAGLVAALDLAEAGRRVVLLEAGGLAANASAASAGQVAPLFYGARKGPDDALARLGEARGTRLNLLVAESGRWLFERIAALGIDCAPRRGLLCLSRSEKSLARAAARFARWRDFGGSAEPVGREALPHHTASRRYAGGFMLPDGGLVDPVGLVEGLAGAAAASGVAIHCHSRAVTLRRQGGAWAARTEAGAVLAPQLLIATGTAGLPAWPALARTVYPVTCGVGTTPPLGGRGVALLPLGGPAVDLDDKAVFSPAIDPGGRMTASFLGSDPAPARRRLARAFPGYALPPLAVRATGEIGVTPDGLPRLLQDGTMMAVTGCNGFGLTLGIIAAREAARFLLGTPPGDLALPLSPPAPLPLPRLMPALFRTVLAPLANRFG